MCGKTTIASLILILTLAAGASTAIADTRGRGAGINVFDGEFGLQVRKDIWLGGDINQITGQGSVFFADRTVFALDLDYHFVIHSEGSASRFYPLAGIDFKFNGDGSDFGVNLGGGANFMMTDKLAAFAELKVVISDWGGLGFGVGLYF
jgi:hypothetical protein